MPLRGRKHLPRATGRATTHVSRHVPHQGKQEMARRRRQIARRQGHLQAGCSVGEGIPR